ncbi:UNVERIFIED_CONTAM: hypothetical protein Slati_0867900 [Sesamum latifolium]|uniref:Uncharacterized protein n=1 Tax=Sesamum latifolium TaxID=2727402 RepID=A0AAW2XMJ6_9LAMI
MIEGSSVQEHGVKMLSLVEKLKDLKANLEKETYIDVILQSLSPSFDSFIVNYKMNGLDKDLHELINMLVQYEATIEKSAPSVLVGRLRPQKRKAKAPDAGGGRRVRQNQLLQALRALLLPRWVVYRSRRLRQMVLKLCNGRAVATMVVGLSRLSY